MIHTTNPEAVTEVGEAARATANELFSQIARLSKSVLVTTRADAGDQYAAVQDLRTVVERIGMTAESGMNATTSMSDGRCDEPGGTTTPGAMPWRAGKSATGALFQELAGMLGTLIEALDDVPTDSQSGWRLQVATALARQAGLMADLAAMAHGEMPAVGEPEDWLPGVAFHAVMRDPDGRAE